MNSLNVLLLEGNLCRDSEFRTTVNGFSLCRFSIACSRYIPNKAKNGYSEEVSFFDIVAWGKMAEYCSDLQKGRKVRIEGRLKQDRWLDSEGKTRTHVVVVANSVSAAPEKNIFDGGGGGGDSIKESSDIYPENYSTDYDDEIPF